MALREMAQNCAGHPGDRSYDDWVKRLLAIADGLEKGHRVMDEPYLLTMEEKADFAAAGKRAMHELADDVYTLWD